MPSQRSKVQRLSERGHYEPEVINEILDANFVCHVGFSAYHGSVVLPTLFGRDGNVVYLHGSMGAHMLRTMRDGVPVCVTVTSVDGIVAARSLFHHSINYRSVVVFGVASEVTDVQEKLHGMEVLTNHVLPGRWDEARQPNTKEFTQTMVLKLSLDEASAKVRTGPPHDEPEDMDLPVWAGVIPLANTAGEPNVDAELKAGQAMSASIKAFVNKLSVS